LWAIAAGAVSFVLALSGRELLRAPALQRTNYAGREIPTAGGVFAVLALVLVTTVAFEVDVFRYIAAHPPLLLVLGFAFLGLLDDVVGTSSARGLRGHVAAARRGQLTSGLLKLAFGLVLAWFTFSSAGVWLHVATTIVIAGSANVANLLDLAPGRAVKGAFIVFAVVIVFAHEVVGASSYWFLFAVLGLLPFELREELMLGDTGANPLGASVGYVIAVWLAGSTLAVWIAAVVVIAINASAEFVSFSRVIERVAPLRALDHLGRRQ